MSQFFLTPYKWGKTLGSVPTYARNFIGNGMGAFLLRNSITNPLNWKWYVKSARIHLLRNGAEREAWKKAIADGATETGYYGRDVPKVAREILNLTPQGFLSRLFDATVKVPINSLGELYNSGDTIYRLAAHLHNLEGRGMWAIDSVEEINRSLQNYRKLPIAVDTLRRWPVFGVWISYQANMVKILYNQATKGFDEINSTNKSIKRRGVGRLLRLALALSFPLMMQEISRRQAGLSAQDVSDINQLYPDYRRNGQFMYFKKGDSIRVLDMSFIYPTGNLEKLCRSILAGDTKSARDALDLFSIPWLDAYKIMVEGKDPLYETPHPGFMDRIEALLKYAYVPSSMPIPSLPGLAKGDIVPGTFTGQQIETLMKAQKGIPGPTGVVKEFPEELQNFATGIKTWNADLAQLYASRRGSILRRVSDIKKQIIDWNKTNRQAKDWQVEMETNKMRKQVVSLKAELDKLDEVRKRLQSRGLMPTSRGR
jgi:hypothetical protein